MNFHKGTRRFVIVFPQLKIALKFPIINVWRTLAWLWKRVTRGQWVEFKAELTYPLEIPPYSWFLEGIANNLFEYGFFLATKHEFLVPTYFSLFGVVNVQGVGEVYVLDRKTHSQRMHKILGDDWFIDTHHLSNPANFCIVGGKLAVLDYGSKGSHGVIEKHGYSIMDQLDLSPPVEGEKK